MSKLSSNEIRRRVIAVLLCAIVAAAASFAAPLSALAEDEAAAPAAADELAGGGGALPEGMPGEAAVPAAAPGEYAVPAATEDADGETDASSDAAYFRALAAGDVQGAWEETPGGWVYLDPAGAPYTGWKSVDGEARYFDPANGGVAPQGWFNHANGQTYYFWWSGKGTFASGLSDIGGRSYYFNGQGHLEAGWQSVDGQARYFDPAQGGAAPQGWFQHSNGHTYYFWWGSGGIFATGTQSIGGKAYGFNAQGHKVVGWQAIDGAARYFDPAQDGAAPQGWFSHSNGHTYYFWWSGKGTFATGAQRIDGRAYGFNAQGHKVTGWQTIDGKVRYFDPAQDGAAPEGWYDQNGSRYYFWPSDLGAFATGLQSIGGNEYYFNDQGHMLKSQVVTVGAWEYTLGADGAVTSKKQLITADIAIETDIVLTGSGTGWHGKVVFMDATHAISFGILHDPAFNPNAGDWLMFESASASGNLQEYTFLEQVASGKHRIRLEWYKDSRLAKGYCDGRYIGEVYTAAISVLNPTIDFIGTARASGDTVDAVFSNFNIDVKGRVPYASHTWKYGSTAATNGPMVFYGDFHSDLINNGGAEYEKGHTYSTVNEWHLWGRAQFPYGDWGTPAFATVGAHAQQIWN